MESSYFYLFVLPLGIFVFTLATLVFYYAKKEEFTHRRLENHLRKQEETFKEQTERLKELRQSKSIDNITYKRLKQILETEIEQKRMEANAQLASLTDENDQTAQR